MARLLYYFLMNVPDVQYSAQGPEKDSPMEQHAIFSATLGLSHPWRIAAVSFSKEEQRMDITIDFDPGCNFICPACGKEGETCDAGCETWHHDNFFDYGTYLHVRVPFVNCPCCGISAAERPW